jgi:membrane-bound lytic murein transglycosylase MltF
MHRPIVRLLTILVAAVLQESRLNQAAKSQVGAIGVMQVMPATGESLKVGDIHTVDPNIHAGVKYVRHLVDQYYAKEPMDEENKTYVSNIYKYYVAYLLVQGEYLQRRELKQKVAPTAAVKQ